MNILVLGGCGAQGRAAVYDLIQSTKVTQVICADQTPEDIYQWVDTPTVSKITPAVLNAADPQALRKLMQSVDGVIDLLPRQFMVSVCEAAIDCKTNLVNTNYAHSISHLDQAAQEAGIAIMPECGLDPGIDLVIFGQAVRRFDEVDVIRSYCGGIPELAASENPLNYKISWTWEGVLSAIKRHSRMVRDGEVVDIPPALQHAPENVGQIDFPGLGTLEAIPNGDAVYFAEQLGVGATIRETGRYTLRWPGWSAFWHPLKQLGFLNEEPVEGLPASVSPYEMMNKLLAPQLQYGEDENDLVPMVNIFEGRMDGRRCRLTTHLLIKRDPETGFMAMGQGVGFPASIVIQMIVGNMIEQRGLLAPTQHVPYELFAHELELRGITISEKQEFLT